MQAQLDQFNKTAPPGEEEDITILHELSTAKSVLDMKGDVLFASGEAKLKPSGEKVLKQVADMVRDKPNKLAICGFTDSDPIKRSKWTSNFDLSGARALAVLDFLEKEGIKPDRMHFCGYGQYALIPDAAGKENKAKSRRAEIILLKEVEGRAPFPPQRRRSIRPSRLRAGTTPMTPK